jgi:hypothetical protein
MLGKTMHKAVPIQNVLTEPSDDIQISRSRYRDVLYARLLHGVSLKHITVQET